MVYLLHFDHKYHHAQHYIGFTDNLEIRIQQHISGTGSKLLKAVYKANIHITIVRIWQGDRKLERLLHNKHNSKRLCPICRNNKWNVKKEVYK